MNIYPAKILYIFTFAFVLTANELLSQEAGPVFGTIPKESQALKEGVSPKKPQKISKEQVFKNIDKDNNGSISKEEWMARKSAKKSPTRAQLTFASTDRDGDQSISLEEYKNPPKRKSKN